MRTAFNPMGVKNNMKTWIGEITNLSAGKWYSINHNLNITDYTKIYVDGYAQFVSNFKNWQIGDIVPIYSLWGMNFRNFSVTVDTNTIGFATSDQISTNNKNTSNEGVNIISAIKIILRIFY